MPKTKSNLPPSPAPSTPPSPKHNAKCSAWFMAQYRPENHALHIYFRRHCRVTSPQWRAKHPMHMPQDSPTPILIASFFAPHLRNFRKYVQKLHVACGTSANMLQNCILLAEFPQTHYKTARYLRNFRKYITKLHGACGTPANILRNCMMIAEVPQASCKNAHHLRKFRK